jgi:plasmid stabilization system protein ParE
MTVILLPGAEEDMDEAFGYYESRHRGLGDDFLEAFCRAVDRILQFPHGWHPMDETYRRCQLHRFPYGIIYRVDEANRRIIITTVMQLNRRPGSWRR